MLRARRLQSRCFMRVRSATYAAAVVLALLALRAAPAAACATCACGDPTLTTMGEEAPYAGRVRFALTEDWRVESDGFFASTRERVDELVTSAAVSYAPWSWLSVSAQLPLTAKVLTAPSEPSLLSFGPADAALRARAVFWRAPHQMAAFTSAAFLPTTTPIRGKKGALLVDDVQPGSGALGGELGLVYSYTRAPFALFTSVRGYAAAPVTLGIAPGPALFGDVVGQWQPAERVALQLGAATRAALAGTSPDGPFGDGIVTFATTGLVFAVVDDLVVNLTVRVPVYEALPLGVYEGSSVGVGVAYDL
jgi:hypothetical protein